MVGVYDDGGEPSVTNERKRSFSRKTGKQYRRTTKAMVKESLPLLDVLSKVGDAERKCILKHLDSDSVNVVCNCIHNAIYNDAIVPKDTWNEIRSQLKQSKKPLHYVSRLTNNFGKRRKLLIQHGGSLPLLLSAVLPIIRDSPVRRRGGGAENSSDSS